MQAVQDFSLDVTEGEFVVLVGPSGCGKSTVLRMIAGLESISEGQMALDQTRINEMPPRERNIAMVFQNYALYPHMTVYDNMAFCLKQEKKSKEEIDQSVDVYKRQVLKSLQAEPSEIGNDSTSKVFQFSVLSEAEINNFIEQIQRTSQQTNNNSIVMNIFMEYTEKYLNGEINEKKAIREIVNRLELYTNE